MSGPRHLPLVGWSKSELLNELWMHEQAIRNLQKEFDRRGERDEQKHGFPIAVHEPGVISTAYRFFDTPAAAYNAAVEYAKETGGDVEAAPYHVHPVYLGKDD